MPAREPRKDISYLDYQETDGLAFLPCTYRHQSENRGKADCFEHILEFNVNVPYCVPVISRPGGDVCFRAHSRHNAYAFRSLRTAPVQCRLSLRPGYPELQTNSVEGFPEQKV